MQHVLENDLEQIKSEILYHQFEKVFSSLKKWILDGAFRDWDTI